MSDQIKFISLVELIAGHGVAVPVLATAIEIKGIQGWDRFGRFKTFKAEDAQAVDALDALAAQRAWDFDTTGALSPVELYETGDEAPEGFCMGWLESDLPDFAAFVAAAGGEPVQPKKNAIGFNADAMHCLIGGLLMFIRGELDDNRTKHQAFTTQEALAKLMSDQLEYPGLSLRNIQNKFGLANRALEFK